MCRKEIEAAIDSESPLYIDSKILSEKLPILTRCLKESMRLNPTVPVVSRHLSEDVVYTDSNTNQEVVLMKDSILLWNLAMVNRNPRWWQRPDEFFPDHFLDENCKQRHPFAFAAFGAGPKSCIGNRFAMQVNER